MCWQLYKSDPADEWELVISAPVTPSWGTKISEWQPIRGHVKKHSGPFGMTKLFLLWPQHQGPQITSGKLSSRSGEDRRKISSNHSIPPQPTPTLRHGVTETSFEPFPGHAKPCWLFCRRCPETRLRDAHDNRQNSDYHPQQRLDRELRPLRGSIGLRNGFQT